MKHPQIVGSECCVYPDGTDDRYPFNASSEPLTSSFLEKFKAGYNSDVKGLEVLVPTLHDIGQGSHDVAEVVQVVIRRDNIWIMKQIGNHAISNLTFKTANPVPFCMLSTTGNSLSTLSKSCMHILAMFLVAEGLRPYRYFSGRIESIIRLEPTPSHKHFQRD